MKKHFLISIFVPCFLVYGSGYDHRVAHNIHVPVEQTTMSIHVQGASMKMQCDKMTNRFSIVRQHDPYADVTVFSCDNLSGADSVNNGLPASNNGVVARRVYCNGRPRLLADSFVYSHNPYANVVISDYDSCRDISSTGTTSSTPSTPTVVVGAVPKMQPMACVLYQGRRIPMKTFTALIEAQNKENRGVALRCLPVHKKS
ncbi:hypothetical protein KBD08_03150 [Candidatus Babeliales bacterium]|nr:hypothetical protein [Candidatus Babeliales bacterium]